MSRVTADERVGALLPAAEQAERGYSSHHAGTETHFTHTANVLFALKILRNVKSCPLLFVYVSLQIITFSGAIGLQSNSACLVGHLHLAHMSTSHSHTAGRCSSSEWSLLVIVCLQNVCDMCFSLVLSSPQFLWISVTSQRKVSSDPSSTSSQRQEKKVCRLVLIAASISSLLSPF